jgi:hypothetical protein
MVSRAIRKCSISLMPGLQANTDLALDASDGLLKLPGKEGV